MLLPFMSYGQWQPDLPLGVLPMQFNPSFAGGVGAPRLIGAAFYSRIIGRTNIKGNTFGSYLSYDQFIPGLRSGIGLSLGHQSTSVMMGPRPAGGFESESTSELYTVSLAVAPKFSIKGKYTLSPSLDFSYKSGEYNSTSYSHIDNGEREWFQSRLGLLFNTQKYYIGYSATFLNRFHLNGEMPDSLQVGFQSSIQAGYTFQRNPDSDFSFTPQLSFSFREREEFLNVSPHINLTARYKRVIGGVSNSGAHLGFQTSNLRLMLSHSLSVFRPSPYIPQLVDGSISLRYIFKKADKTGPASW